MKEENIRLLNNQLEKLTQLQSDTKYGSSLHQVNAWIAGTKGLLERIFGKESIKIKEIDSIKNETFFDLSSGSKYDLTPVKSIGSSIIETCISEIEELGLPDHHQTNDRGINLTMIQNQSSKQQISINVITKALNQELTGNQLKEIEELLEKVQKPEERKQKLKEKLIEFGSNTLSGIISGILINLGTMG